MSNIPDSLLQQVFAVRFLGSMAVRAGHTQEVIYEAMRQVLAARAIHNIFKTTESHLMVTSSCIRCVCRLTSELDSYLHSYRMLKTVFVSVNRLIDPQTQVTKISVSVDVLISQTWTAEASQLCVFVSSS